MPENAGSRLDFGAGIRSAWLLDPDVSFLNHGSFGATPRVVLEAQDRWRQRMERQPVRFFTRDLLPLLRESARALARFVGSAPDDLVFVENATTGVNAVLGSFSFEPGDEIATTAHVYGAVLSTLRHHAARSGASVVVAELPLPLSGPDEVVEAVTRVLTPRTRLLVIDHVTSFSGAVLPIERVIAVARQRGVPVLVDGAHAPGMLPLDLAALGADFYTGNCHKWLFTPKGCAFLWAHPRWQSSLVPTVISWGYGEPWPVSFDFGPTRDPSAWLCVPDALAFVDGFGIDRIRAYDRELVERAAALLSERWQVPLPLPASMRGSMAAIRHPRSRQGCFEEARRLHDELLDEHRIEVPITAWGGVCWLRISAQIYNEIGEYERLAEAVV